MVNVLSLFDGMSCGRIALERTGIEVTNYLASEIDKYAIQISEKNYPNTIQLGDVTKWRGWNLPKIDLLIAGSPCQGFSIAGKKLNFDDPRSKLFFDFVDILKYYKPKYWMLENVRMATEWENIISQQVGISPVQIGSSLVSAQNRERLYWTNINAGVDLYGNLIPGIPQPEDRGILLKDILEGDQQYLAGRTVGRNPDDPKCRKKGEPRAQSIEINQNPNKTNCLSTAPKDNTLIPVIKNHGVYKPKTDKSMCLDANYYKGPDNHGQRTMIQVGTATDIKGHDSIKRIYSDEGKSPMLSTMQGGHREPKVAIRDKSKTVRSSGLKSFDKHEWDSVSDCHYRKLTPIECERLQTVPDNYTEGVSNTQRYKMLGNGFTVDVISFILGFII